MWTKFYKIVDNCDFSSCLKYDRNSINSKFHHTKTASTTNEIIHADKYVNSHQSVMIFIDKFSNHAIHFHLRDRNRHSIVQKIEELWAIKGNINKFAFDNDFNVEDICKVLN